MTSQRNESSASNNQPIGDDPTEGRREEAGKDNLPFFFHSLSFPHHLYFILIFMLFL